MIFYLTYNDVPSGIFSSQVIDVVRFLNKELKSDVKLVSFISLRNFFNNRKKIKKEYKNAIVFPMFPGVHRWRWNSFFLGIVTKIMKPSAIIGRSVLATQLALILKRKNKIKAVVYDGRGAIAAEWKEYKVITNPKMLKEIPELEHDAIHHSDFRIAVSHELTQFWNREYGYKGIDYVVIPCTLNRVFEDISITSELISSAKKLLKFKSSDIVFAYSGSIAGWQSFDLLYHFMKPILSKNKNVKILFLANSDENILKLEKEFTNQVIYKKVSAHEVPNYLIGTDYGILIREESVTNRVASPVKFAEYLACGLNVVISPKLGDYSNFVEVNNCGNLFSQFVYQNKIDIDKKNENNKLAIATFTKNNFIKEYKRILNSCN